LTEVSRSCAFIFAQQKMKLTERINALAEWGAKIESSGKELEPVLVRYFHENKWFTIDNSQLALQSITDQFLKKDLLTNWLRTYNLPEENNSPKDIGLILAGNIPLVGFHDLLSVLATGNTALLKLSSKDSLLLKMLIEMLAEISPELASQIKLIERLEKFDATISTGNDNSSRYFKYYFGKKPNIIRRNRTSVAVLNGNESTDELKLLGEDVFRYFGLGCRNVSKLFVPENYDLKILFEAWKDFEWLKEHDKYMNNYDYNRTLLILNQQHHLANDFLMITENENLSSPVATLHYEKYKTENELVDRIASQMKQIQCIVSRNDIPFGKSQQPELADYADGVDTIEFLRSLN